MAATRTDRRVLPDKEGAFTTRELTEFIRQHEIDLVALQEASDLLNSGKRTTLVAACLEAGMTEEQISAILVRKVDAETNDSVFVSQLLFELGQTKSLAKDALGAAEAATQTANEAKTIAADAYTAAAPSQFNWVAAGIMAVVWFIVCILWVQSEWKVPIYSANGKLVGEGVGFADSNWAFMLVVLTGVLLVAAFGWFFATKQQHESASDPDATN